MTQPATAADYPLSDEENAAIAEAVSKLPPLSQATLESVGNLFAAMDTEKWSRVDN